MAKFKYRPIKRTGKKKDDIDAHLQFILDHSSPINSGFHCQFFFKNMKDLKGRIQARKYGLERLDSINEEWKDVKKKFDEYNELKNKLKLSRELKGIKKWIYFNLINR